MSQILPPRGYHRTDRIGPLADSSISAEAYRLWKVIDALAWDGQLVMADTLDDLNDLLGSLIGKSPTTVRKLRASLVNRGLVVVATSGGMTTLEACEVDVDNSDPHGDNLPPTDRKIEEALDETGGEVVKNDHNWSDMDGHFLPLAPKIRRTNKLNNYSSYSLINDGVVKNDHKRQELTTNGNITPLLAEMCQRLQDLGIYRRPALIAAQRAIAENLTADQLVAIAKARIAQSKGELALAASLLRDEPLAVNAHLSDTKRRFREELD
jgi:hypothetical protein